ncbi:MAG: subtilisin [Verrucomicrobiales bacterium]|jgi:subtilisin
MKTVSSLALVTLVLAQAAAAQVIPDHYIVVLNNKAAEAGNAAQGLVRQHGGKVGHVYRNAIKGFSFQGSAAAAQAISRNPNVAYVEADLEAHAVQQTLVTGVNRVDADQNGTANINGNDDRVDVDVAILDTGIDVDHPDLPPIIGGKHFYTITSGRPSQRGSSADDNYDDDNGHGTHVAGTVAALDNAIGVVGVAPGARLWAVKVLDSNGSGTFGDIIKGIDFITANADEIEVVNMSLGGQGRLSSLRTAIQASVEAGVVYVVAAANDSMDVYGPDGVFGTSDDVIPASYPEVATVSAMGDTDGVDGGTGPDTTRFTADDTFADFTNFSASVISENPVISPGAAIDVAGPGVDITSTYIGGGYAVSSGTSMASPHVAGLAALEIAANGRALNAVGVAEIRQALIDGAQAQADWGPANTNDPDGKAEGLAIAASGTPNTAPIVLITSPADNANFSSGATITFTGSASDIEDGDLTASLLWYLDNVQLPTSDSPGSFSTVLSDGQHTITASVADAGGKTGFAMVDVFVGNPPTQATEAIVTSITYTTNGGRNSDKNLQITVTVEDNFGVSVAGASVSITLNRNGSLSASGSASTTADGTATFSLRNASSGTYNTVVNDVQAGDLNWNGLTPVNEFVKVK